MKLRTKLVIVATVLFMAAVAYTYFGRIEHSRDASPDGRYYEVVSHRPIYYLPLPIYRWGVHSDSPSFVSVEDSEGRSYGEVPVPLLQMAKVTWNSGSAYIPSVAEWNLNAQTCFYWSEVQTKKIYTKK